MTIENQNKILKILEENPTTTVEVVVDRLKLGRQKVKQSLYELKYKNKITIDDEVITLLSESNASNPEQIEENSEPSPEDNSRSSSVQVSNPEQTTEETDSVSEEKVELLQPETQHLGLTAQVENLNEKFNLLVGAKEKKEKKSRLKKFSIGKLKRFNKGQNRAVILLTRNQNGRLIKGEAIHGMIKIPTPTGDNYYDGSAIYTWLWEGKQPCYIIPEWSIRPLSASEFFSKALKDKLLIDSQQITLRAMKMLEQDAEEGDKKKKPMNMMMMVGIVIVGLIVAWLFFGGKK